jgi:hypothetical protein
MKLRLISFHTKLKDYMSEAVHIAFRVVALKKAFDVAHDL